MVRLSSTVLTFKGFARFGSTVLIFCEDPIPVLEGPNTPPFPIYPASRLNSVISYCGGVLNGVDIVELALG
jgi:hypothetical protein